MPSAVTSRATGIASLAAIKAPVRVATTANVASLAGLLTIDGVGLADGDRVLVRAQSDTTQNGIYVAETGTWERSPDCDGATDLVKGTMVFVTNGNTLAAKMYWVSTTNPTPGSALAFTLFAA